MGCGGKGGLRLMLLGLDTAVGGGGARLLDFLLERLELRGLRWLGGPPCFLLVPFKWVEVQASSKHDLLETEVEQRAWWNLEQSEPLEQPCL